MHQWRKKSLLWRHSTTPFHSQTKIMQHRTRKKIVKNAYCGIHIQYSVGVSERKESVKIRMLSKRWIRRIRWFMKKALRWREGQKKKFCCLNCYWWKGLRMWRWCNRSIENIKIKYTDVHKYLSQIDRGVEREMNNIQNSKPREFGTMDANIL